MACPGSSSVLRLRKFTMHLKIRLMSLSEYVPTVPKELELQIHLFRIFRLLYSLPLSSSNADLIDGGSHGPHSVLRERPAHPIGPLPTSRTLP